MSAPDLEDEIHRHLTTNLGVQAIVSGQVYPDELPQEASIPAVVFRQISTVNDYDNDTKFLQKHTRKQRFEFICIDSTSHKAKTLSRLVNDAIEGWHGELTGTWLNNVFRESGPIAGAEIIGEKRVKTRTQDYMFHHVEK